MGSSKKAVTSHKSCYSQSVTESYLHIHIFVYFWQCHSSHQDKYGALMGLYSRFEITGIEAANLQNAMPFKHVRYQVNSILGSVRLLVGHDLRHDLACLHLDYPPHLIRWALLGMFMCFQGCGKSENCRQVMGWFVHERCKVLNLFLAARKCSVCSLSDFYKWCLPPEIAHVAVLLPEQFEGIIWLLLMVNCSSSFCQRHSYLPASAEDQWFQSQAAVLDWDVLGVSHSPFS